MGLRDIFNGMLNGPRGQRQPSSGGSGGGMSQIMMALLGLLAYEALKGNGGQVAPTDPGNPSAPRRAAGSRDRSQTAVGDNSRSAVADIGNYQQPETSARCAQIGR